MHASSTQSLADLRTPAKAALAAIIFAAGIVVGAVVGTTVVPGATAASGTSVGLDSDAPWFRAYRAGERNLQPAGVSAQESGTSVGLDSDAPWFREYRAGERGDATPNRLSRDLDASHPGGGGR
jgi:hypothetical protein